MLRRVDRATGALVPGWMSCSPQCPQKRRAGSSGRPHRGQPLGAVATAGLAGLAGAAGAGGGTGADATEGALVVGVVVACVDVGVAVDERGGSTGAVLVG